MSDLRPRGMPVTINGTEWHFLFTLNAIDEIQDKTGKSLYEVMAGLTKQETVLKTARDLTMILANDEIQRRKFEGDECAMQLVTEKQAGWMIDLQNIKEITRALFEAYGCSMPEPEEDDPNGESGRQKD